MRLVRVSSAILVTSLAGMLGTAPGCRSIVGLDGYTFDREEDAGEGGYGGYGGHGGYGGSGEHGGYGGSGGTSLVDAGCDPDTQMDTPACNSCLQGTQCSNELSECQNSTECMALNTCMQGCSTESCYVSCAEQHSTTLVAYFLALGCMDASCHDACYCSGCRFGITTSCHTCIQSSCDTVCSGCDRDEYCMAAVYCMNYSCASTDSDCQNACLADYPAAKGPYLAMFGSTGCATLECDDACQ